MRFVYITTICFVCYQIPYFAGLFISQYWEVALPLFMFFGGMIYKSYLQYDKKKNSK